MIVDAHQHFWQYRPEDYGWISADMAVLQRDYLPEDLARERQVSGVAGSIAVQARQNLVETRWLLELAEKHREILGVVGWVPLRAPQVPALLDELLQRPALKGVRHVVQDEPDPAFLAGADFNRGVDAVAERGLTYDLLIKSHQLSAAIEFVDRHPTLTVVLDHLGKPVVEGPPRAEWAQGIRELALRPHVYCKVSGLVTEVVGEDLSDDVLNPYVELVLEAFGPRRVMYGSDWPVCRLRMEHVDWVNYVKRALGRYSAEGQDRVLHGTAYEAYRIS
jgi:L-fuconolactonase